MIPSKVIREYLLNKFTTDYRLESGETELVIPSIFVKHDYKRHMNINLETGLWRCFKTGNKGNFLSLYSKLENVSYAKAYEKYLFDIILYEDNKTLIQKRPEYDVNINDVLDTFLPLTRDYIDMPLMKAIVYLYDRKIIGDDFIGRVGFYLGTGDSGIYNNRLIIPFKRQDGTIFFFQARALYPDQEPKYLNWKGYRASSILYPYEVDSLDQLFICEGVMDALSLKKIGLQATTTTSCQTSEEQIEQLKHYQGDIVVAFDGDEAGVKGRNAFNKLRKQKRMGNCYYVEPYDNCKDWNEMLVKGKLEVKELISRVKKFDSDDEILIGL